MTDAIVSLGYQPEIVQSRFDAGPSVDGLPEHVPEPVAAALKQALTSGELVFIDFYADWCGACKTMHRTTFKDAEVEQAFSRFVFLKVDADNFVDAARHFDVIGLPTLLVLDAHGVELYRQVGPIVPSGVEGFARDLSLLADQAQDTQ